MGFYKQIPCENLSCFAGMKIHFPNIVGWNLSQLNGLKFHPSKTGSCNHHLSTKIVFKILSIEKMRI